MTYVGVSVRAFCPHWFQCHKYLEGRQLLIKCHFLFPLLNCSRVQPFPSLSVVKALLWLLSPVGSFRAIWMLWCHAVSLLLRRTVFLGVYFRNECSVSSALCSPFWQNTFWRFLPHFNIFFPPLAIDVLVLFRSANLHRSATLDKAPFLPPGDASVFRRNLPQDLCFQPGLGRLWWLCCLSRHHLDFLGAFYLSFVFKTEPNFESYYGLFWNKKEYKYEIKWKIVQSF